MNHWMFKCRDVTRLVSESMDRKMTLQERMGVRMHLIMCHLCRRHKRQLEFIRGLMAAYRRHLEQNPAEEQLSTEARLRMKQILAARTESEA